MIITARIRVDEFGEGAFAPLAWRELEGFSEFGCLVAHRRGKGGCCHCDEKEDFGGMDYAITVACVT